jgi:hypothetical protein
MSAPGGRRDVQASVGCWSILVISVVIRERTSRSPAWGSASGDAAACCEDGFLAAATVPAAMLIKNRFHHLAAQRTWCPVTAVPVITSVTSLGSTFAGLPGLLAHRLARTYSFGRTGHRIVSRRMAYHRPDGCSATARHCAAMPSRATRPGRFPAAPPTTAHPGGWPPTSTDGCPSDSSGCPSCFEGRFYRAADLDQAARMSNSQSVCSI